MIVVDDFRHSETPTPTAWWGFVSLGLFFFGILNLVAALAFFTQPGEKAIAATLGIIGLGNHVLGIFAALFAWKNYERWGPYLLGLICNGAMVLWALKI